MSCNNKFLVFEKTTIPFTVDAGCPDEYEIVNDGEGEDVLIANQQTGDLVIHVKPVLPAGWKRMDQDLIYFTDKPYLECLQTGLHFIIKHIGSFYLDVKVDFVCKPFVIDDEHWVFYAVEKYGLPYFRELNKHGVLFVAVKISFPNQLISFSDFAKVCQEPTNTEYNKHETANARPLIEEEVTNIKRKIVQNKNNSNKNSNFTELPDDEHKTPGCTHQ